MAPHHIRQKATWYVPQPVNSAFFHGFPQTILKRIFVRAVLWIKPSVSRNAQLNRDAPFPKPGNCVHCQIHPFVSVKATGE
jgi:hypothetical protein